MRPVHYITIGAALLLAASLYFFGNTIPPKTKPDTATAAGHEQGTQHAAPASFDTLLVAARATLPKHGREEVKLLEDSIANTTKDAKAAPLYRRLAIAWQEHKQFPIAAFYYAQEGKLENSEKKLNFAAQLFLDLARKSQNEAEQAWEGQMAIEGFKAALAINPDNDTTKLNLAECYIGTGETMQGVVILRDLTIKNPNNAPANLLLGQQGIVSGQFDKAIARFDKVLKVEPKNIEAILGMAEAYKNKGDKAKAIELLEQSKKVMNNPAFSKDIDQYINTFK